MNTSRFVRERLAEMMNPDTFVGQQNEIRRLENEVYVLRAQLKAIYECQTLTGREAVQVLLDKKLLKLEDVT